MLGSNGTGNLENIVMVSAGGESTNGRSMALAGDGTIWVWGRNNEGQLGNGQVAGATILPVAHAQNHVAEGELQLTVDTEVIKPQSLGEVNITATASHTNPAVSVQEVKIYRNGAVVPPTEPGGTACNDCGLSAGTYHIYAMATDSNQVTVMSAAQVVTIIDPAHFVVTPGNGSTRTSTISGPLEYWLGDGDKSIELNVALHQQYHDTEITVVAVDSTVTPAGQPQSQTLHTRVTGSGATRRMTIDLYRDAEGDPISVVGPVTISAYLRADETEAWTEAWTTAYRPRVVIWEISQPISALKPSPSGSTPVTLPGTRFRNGEIAKLVRSEGGCYKVRSTFNIDTFGDPSLNDQYTIALRGLPDQSPQIAPGSTTSFDFDFEFKIKTFSLGGADIRLDLIQNSGQQLLCSTPLSLHGRSSGTGIQYSGTAWKLSYDETTDEGYKQECGNCGNESGTETFSYLNREGSMCAAGYLSPDSTPDNHVDASYDLGTSAAGAGGMKADFKTDDLSDPGIASPANMELSGTESPQVTTDPGGTYAQTIQTATGTTQVTDIQPDGYTLTFTGTGQSTPTTSLRLVRTELAANHWSLRFIEKRHLGTVVETRYEQTKNSDGSETWKVLEGAELTSLSDPAAAENSFLRRTTILRSATAVVSVTPLLGTSPAPIPQFTEQVTVDEMTADTSVWETVSVTLNTFRVFPWGDPIVSQVLDPANRALTRRWDYHTQTGGDFGTLSAGPMSTRPGTLAGFQDYDGFWQQLTWDSEGRIAKVRSPFLDSPSSAADIDCEVWTFTYGVNTRRDVHKIQGVSVSESIAEGVETLRSLQRLPSSAAGAWDPGNLITIIARAPVAAITDPNFKFAASSYRITIIVRPDETAHTCAWSYSGANLVKSCKDGNATLTKGTSTVTTSDLIGNAVSTVSGVLDFGGTAGIPQNLSTVTRSNLDPLGRPTTSTTAYTDGSPAQTESWTYSCCGILNSTDHRGILTKYHHDHLKRRESTTSLGVVHGIQYNGRERRQLRIPRALVPQGQILPNPDPSKERIHFRGMASFPVGTILQGETTTNTAGETTLERNPSPQHTDGVTMVSTTTAHSYLPNAITRNFPDGGQSVSTWTADRRSRGTYGSAVDASGLAYSTTPQGNGSVFTETRYLGDYARSGQEYVTTGYDLLGRPVITLYPDGAFATMHYNDLGQLIKSVDPDGVTTLFAYNDEGERTHSAADLNGNGLLDLDTDRVSFSETNAATAPDGITKTWETLSRVYREGDSGVAGGLVAGRSYRSIDGLKSWSVPFGIAARTSTSVTILYGSGSWDTTTLSADNHRSYQFTYNGLPYHSYTAGGDGGESFGYQTHTHDAHNRLQITRDGRTGDTSWTYTNSDHISTSTLELTGGDLVTAYGFDPMGRTLTVDSPDTLSSTGATLPNLVTREYDKRGNVTKISGEQTYDVDYTYDSLSRMKTLTTRYGVANGGQGSTQVTEWIYHPQRGWLLEKNYPGESGYGPAGATDYSYTPGGRLQAKRWERDADFITYYYDFQGRDTGFGLAAKAGDLAHIDYLDDVSADVTYRYARWGAVEEIDDITGTRRFNHRTDIDLQVMSEETSVPGTVPAGGIAIPKKSFHAYDSLGRRTGHRVGAPDGNLTDHAVQYGFDPQTGRLKDIIHGDTNFGIPQKAFTKTYLAHSQLPDTLTAPLHETVRSWESYRDALMSISSTTPGAGGTNFLTAAYGDANFAVNGIGQRTSAVYSGEIYQSLYSSQENYSAAGAYTYGYNANGELVSQTGGKSHGYQYDPIGNRLEATAAGNTVATYQPNALNQYAAITTAGPTTVNPQHDPDGNLVNDGSKRYVWDAENRLIEVRQATGDALVASYRYDFMSRRIHKLTTSLAPQGASEAVFVYDGWNLSGEYSISNNQASVTRAYTWGLDLSGSLQGAGGVGGLLAIENKTAGSSLQGVYYPLYDGNGNVLATLRDTGTSTLVADAYHYDPFGRTLLSAGNSPSDNPFRFSTKYFDKETGLYYYGYRYYDPVTGRWPSRDPIEEEGGVNLYGYAVNSPVVEGDFLGLGLLCIHTSCLDVDLNRYLYLAEREPIDPATGDPMPPTPRSLPKPGECVKADAVYFPGGAIKIGFTGRVDVICPCGQPRNSWNDGGVWGLGNGAYWEVGTVGPNGNPPSDSRWPNLNSGPLPPYENQPPVPLQPPLDPFREFIGEGPGSP